MRELPTGTVTLLFTDIEGSTRLLQRMGDRYASLLETCRSLLRAAFLEFHGHEVDTQVMPSLWLLRVPPMLSRLRLLLDVPSSLRTGRMV